MRKIQDSGPTMVRKFEFQILSKCHIIDSELIEASLKKTIYPQTILTFIIWKENFVHKEDSSNVFRKKFVDSHQKCLLHDVIKSTLRSLIDVTPA